MKKVVISALMLVVCLLTAACGSPDRKQVGQNGYTPSQTSDNLTLSSNSTDGYVRGHWSDEKFVRSNGYTYPYEFDEPLLNCNGFMLNFAVTEVSKGNLDGNYRWEVYVRTAGGDWKSVYLFSMEDDSFTDSISLDSPMDIEAVAVVCQKKGEYAYSSYISVRSPW